MKTKILILVAILFVSCSSGEDNYTVEMVDGVRVVHNLYPKWEENSKIKLEYVQSYGTLENSDKNYLMHKIKDMSIDREGNIYILDSGNYRIQKFDKTGQYLKTISRKGQGPGELENPFFIDIDNSGSIYVSDYSNHRIQVFDPEGKGIASLNKKLTNMLSIRKRNTTNGFYYLMSALNPADKKTWDKLSPMITSIDDKGEFNNSFVEPTAFRNMFENFEGNGASFTLDMDDNVFISFSSQNRLEKYNKSGKLSLEIYREFDYELREIDYGDENKPKYGTPVSKDIGVDSKERIWVVSYNQRIDLPEERKKYSQGNDIYEYQIFSKDGQFLQKIQLNSTFEKFRIFGDRIFLIETREAYQVKEYKIVG